MTDRIHADHPHCGAMQVGDRVRVAQIVEQDMLDGNTSNYWAARGHMVEGPSPELRRMISFVGRRGRIVGAKTGEDGGIGETPGDPLYLVRFRTRSKRPTTTVEVFWTEELRRA